MCVWTIQVRRYNKRGTTRVPPENKLTEKNLTKTANVKDLGIHVAADVLRKQHTEETIKKAKKVLYMFK